MHNVVITTDGILNTLNSTTALFASEHFLLRITITITVEADYTEEQH